MHPLLERRDVRIALAVSTVAAVGWGVRWFFQRKEIGVAAAELMRRLPNNLKLWAPELATAHVEAGLSRYGVSAFDLAGILARESDGGWARAFIHPTPQPPFVVSEAVLKEWLANGTGDGGHGHGLMQIDDRSFGPWLSSRNWRDGLTNIRKGAEVLRDKIRFFVQGPTSRGLPSVSRSPITRGGVKYRVGGQATDARIVPDLRPLTPERAKRAGIAAYNAGELNVLLSLGLGASPDMTTAGGDYSRWVLAHADQYAQGGVSV